MRSRRSRRRFAAPLPWSPCSNVSTTGLGLQVSQKEETHTCLSLVVVVVVVVVVVAGWGVGGFRNAAAKYISYPHTPALAIVCPREEWCENSARAMATVIRSCRGAEPSLSSSLCSTPRGLPAIVHTQQVTQKKRAHLGQFALLLLLFQKRP